MISTKCSLVLLLVGNAICWIFGETLYLLGWEDSPYLVGAVCWIISGHLAYLTDQTKSPRKSRESSFKLALIVAFLASFLGMHLRNRGINHYDSIAASCSLSVLVVWVGLDKVSSKIMRVALSSMIRTIQEVEGDDDK